MPGGGIGGYNCVSEATLLWFNARFDVGEIFFQLFGSLSTNCEVSWGYEFTNGIETQFTVPTWDGPPGTFVFRVLRHLTGGEIEYDWPTTDGDIIVTATVTCPDCEDIVQSAVVHYVYNNI